jgi:translation elongation factor EF-G
MYLLRNQPVVKVSVEVNDVFLVKKLEEGLRLLQQADPSVEVEVLGIYNFFTIKLLLIR